MNQAPANPFRFWPKWKHWGFSEDEAKDKFEIGQLKWARQTKSSYEHTQQWHDENGKPWGASPTKRKQYEAACRILMLHAIEKS